MCEKGRGGILGRVGEDQPVLLQLDRHLHGMLVVRLQGGEDAVGELGQDRGAPWLLLQMHQNPLVRHFKCFGGQIIFVSEIIANG